MRADVVSAQAIAHAVAWALVHFVWQGAAFWLALAVVRALTRAASAPVRYACACATLAAMALAPAITAARLLRGHDGELRILRVLWARGPSTVREVHDALGGDREGGYTTVLKLLQIMHDK